MSALIPNPKNYFANTDRNLYKIVHSFVEEGQNSGEFKRELSTNEITMLITRCMRGTLYDWCLFENHFDLLRESQKFLNTVLAGVKV